MPETSRARSNRQIWITRGHLAALAISTASLAMLTFFLGVRVGRGTVPSTQDLAVQATLLPNADSQASLELLLREVELAQASLDPTGQPQTDVEYTELLRTSATATPAAASLPTGTVSIAANDTSHPRPPTFTPPESGWSVQVSSTPLVAAADQQVAGLIAAGHRAYRVDALVDGQNWYRVRVGGFDTRDEADAARRILAVQTSTPDLALAEAP